MLISDSFGVTTSLYSLTLSDLLPDSKEVLDSLSINSQKMAYSRVKELKLFGHWEPLDVCFTLRKEDIHLVGKVMTGNQVFVIEDGIE